MFTRKRMKKIAVYLFLCAHVQSEMCRCHTSAHQAELLRKGEKRFLVTGDVYRRDSVDRTHYPVFHQMEGFRVFTPEEVEASGMSGV
jgi:phenylalanyl-tRNA synthetase alpha subunit